MFREWIWNTKLGAEGLSHASVVGPWSTEQTLEQRRSCRVLLNREDGLAPHLHAQEVKVLSINVSGPDVCGG